MRVGIDDSFFALGGDSILSIQLVARARARGVVFTPRDVFEQKTVAGLSSVAVLGESETITLAELPGGGLGWAPLLPFGHLMLDRGGDFSRFVQMLTLELPAGITREQLVATLTAVVDRHDVLRSKLVIGDGPGLEIAAPGTFDVDSVLHRIPAAFAVDPSAVYTSALDRLDPVNGVMLQIIWLDSNDSGRLIVIAHHLVVDGVSWRVIVPDLVVAWNQISAGQEPSLPAVGTSFRRWAHALADHAPGRVGELDMWRDVLEGPDPVLGDRPFTPSLDTVATVKHHRVTVAADVARKVLTDLPTRYRGGVNDGLLTALALTMGSYRRARGQAWDSTLLQLEGHGREEEVIPGAELSRTVGWFTSVFPVRLDIAGVDLDDALAGGAAAGTAIKAIKEQLRNLPDKGLGYGMLRYLNAETESVLSAYDTGQISFNYLGRVGTEIPAGLTDRAFLPVEAGEELTDERSSDMPANKTLDINAFVNDTGEMTVDFAYPTGAIDFSTVESIATTWLQALRALATHVDGPEAGGLTPSDVPLAKVSQREISAWEALYPQLEDIWSLSPLQSGLLFHAILAESSVDVYISQVVLKLTGVVDPARLQKAAQVMVARYPNLRAAYATANDGRPVQLVMDSVDVPWREVDLRGEADAAMQLQDMIFADRQTWFDPAKPPLIRYTLVRLADDVYELIVAVHHVLIDGWSMPLMLKELLFLYAAHGDGSVLPAPRSYKTFLEWIDKVDFDASVQAWRAALAGVDEPTTMVAGDQRREISTLAGEYKWTIDPALATRLTSYASELGVTVNTVIQAVWGILLAKYTGRTDVVFGNTVAGRPPELAGVEEMIGLFINTVPARINFSMDESVATFLLRLQGEQSDLLDHHYVGLPQIQAAVGAGATFDTLYIYESYPVDEKGIAEQASNIDGMALADVDMTTITHYPLTFLAVVQNEVRFTLQYLREVFDEDTVSVIASRVTRVLHAIVEKPAVRLGDIDLLDDGERVEILEKFNATAHDLDPSLRLPDLFAAQAVRSPNALAVVFEGDHLTYAEFSTRVNQLARHLISLGVGPDSRVALGMRRSLDLVVGMYAVLTAGGAYVPIDPDHPAERTDYVLDTAQPVCLLTTSRDAFATPVCPVIEIDALDLSGVRSDPVARPEFRGALHPNNAAYVLFTSGSTGRPKGVVITHAAIVNQTLYMNDRYGLTSDDVYLQKTATTFDVSLWGFFMPLAVGATLVVAAPEGHRDPAYLSAKIAEHGVTVSDFVPSMLAVFAAEAKRSELTTLKQIFVIGEALPTATVAAMRQVSTAAVHNVYGPTEATVSITEWEADDLAIGTVPIGAPQWNSQVYVLDSRLQPVPVGIAGELYLAGVQLARGYFARPDLTSDRFVANPFTAGERMYRTGDLVRWIELPTGRTLDYIGRTDFQVKFRGQRIELGEIENALLQHPAVSQSVVIVRDSEIGQQLVAYVVPVPGAEVTGAELRQVAAHDLPKYMVPEAVMVLDAFPLNTAGKLDRKALPAPVFEVRAYRAPSTPTEATVAQVFMEVLGLDRVGRDDDFFGLGGNSLLATQVVARLSAAFDTHLPIRVVFESPVVSELAAALESHAGGGGRQALVAQVRPERIPLSLAQQRMWFLNRFDPESGVNNIPIGVRMTGVLDVVALKRAVRDVVARHEVLRTLYPEVNGVGVQRVLSSTEAGVELDIVTVSGDDVLARVVDFVSAGFDITSAPPVRATLFSISETDHVLAVVVHHISGDGFSMGPLARDVMIAYNARVQGEAPSWTPLPVQFADFALWQRSILGSEDDADSLISQQVSYWKRDLAGIPAVLDLPSDRPRPAVASYRGLSRQSKIDAELANALRKLARQHDASLFMVVHAALAMLLAQLSGTRDIVIGTPIAGRGERELDDLIGMFVNTLVLRTEVDPNLSLTEFLARVREHDLGAFAHADVPFERLVEVLNPARSQAYSPLFQVMLTFQNTAPVALELPDLRVEGLDYETGQAKFDLQFTLDDRENGEIALDIRYASDLYDGPTIDVFGERFLRLLAAISRDSVVATGDVSLLSDAESAEIASWNETACGVDGSQTLVSLFERQVGLTPDAVAVVCEGECFTYAE
ncbi:MAG: amino acid adenylation domain-containing protein, partial [Nocardiaceae bacterium]|nr:amino acid adenylation domain-containing protein [Nocardiaceae bacterium]